MVVRDFKSFKTFPQMGHVQAQWRLWDAVMRDAIGDSSWWMSPPQSVTDSAQSSLVALSRFSPTHLPYSSFYPHFTSLMNKLLLAPAIQLQEHASNIWQIRNMHNPTDYKYFLRFDDFQQYIFEFQRILAKPINCYI